MSDASEQESVAQRLRANATGIVSMLVTGIWLGAMVTGQDWWLVAMLVGYVAVVPITGVLFGDDEENEIAERAKAQVGERTEGRWQEAPEEEETALETLRRRYAEGELSEAQFERKLDQLLETETMEDAEAYASRTDRERAADRER